MLRSLCHVVSFCVVLCRFIEGILGYYYKSDDYVQKDTELQKWIQEIFEYGFLSQTVTETYI